MRVTFTMREMAEVLAAVRPTDPDDVVGVRLFGNAIEAPVERLAEIGERLRRRGNAPAHRAARRLLRAAQQTKAPARR